MTYAGGIARSMVVAAVAVTLLLIGLAGERGRRDLWTTHLPLAVWEVSGAVRGVSGAPTGSTKWRRNAVALAVIGALLLIMAVGGAVHGAATIPFAVVRRRVTGARRAETISPRGAP